MALFSSSYTRVPSGSPSAIVGSGGGGGGGGGAVMRSGGNPSSWSMDIPVKARMRIRTAMPAPSDNRICDRCDWAMPIARAACVWLFSKSRSTIGFNTDAKCSAYRRSSAFDRPMGGSIGDAISGMALALA